MSRFCALFSSSSGNSTYIGGASSGVLIDAGVSARRLKTALLQRDIEPSRISAVFVTHGHSDHILGLRVFASNYQIPVYATAGTIGELEREGMLNGKFEVHEMPEGGVETAGLYIKSFPTPHDCAQSCGYVMELPDGRTAAVVTDIGHMTDEIMGAISGRDLVVLESNHDVGMLENGPYPYYLKRRILSDYGHLSNAACAAAAVKLISAGTTRLYLGHLSTQNNIPDLAWQTTYCALNEAGALPDRDYILKVNPKESLENTVIF